MSKPDGWNSFSEEQKKQIALNFRVTSRGRMMLGQAIARALIAMRNDEFPEYSNIEDLEILSVLFEPWVTHYTELKD